MKRLLIVAALAAAGMAASAVQAQNLLSNGNLDMTYQQLIVDNPDPDPDFFLPKPTIWINEGTRAITGPYEDEMSSEPWAGPAPTPVTTETVMEFSLTVRDSRGATTFPRILRITVRP